MTVTQPQRTSGFTPDTTGRRDEKRTGSCLNCGETLHGPFCSACGQRDIPPYPSARELAVDAFEELSGWDGRFASTLRALVAKPGMLTREFLEGRRARYIAPLRLYLAASLVYFLLAAAVPNVRLDSGQTLFLGLHIGTDTTQHTTQSAPPSRAERLGNAARESVQNGGAITAQERAAALEDLSKTPSLLRPVFRRAIDDPVGLKHSMLVAMPRMLFLLLPLFAALVALFYRGRKYPEHLYFALHLHAFLFLALGLSALSKFTHAPPIAIAVGLGVLLWIPVYATIAFRRVYGGSLVGTIAKETSIAVVYCAISAVAFVATVYWASTSG